MTEPLYTPEPLYTQDSAPGTWADLVDLARHWQNLEPDADPLLPLHDAGVHIYAADGTLFAVLANGAE